LEKKKIKLNLIRKVIENSAKQISKELIWKVYFELSLLEERFGNLNESRIALVNSVIHSLDNLRWKCWLLGSRIELNCKNYTKSKELLIRALQEVPIKQKSIVLIELAKYEEYMGNLSNARKYLKESQIESKNNDWKVFLESILLEIRNKNIENAIKESEKSLKIHKRTGRLWAILIQLNYIYGEKKQLQIFKEALNEVPKSGEVNFKNKF
jgi:tetratricopeptide (TPR) repeat protein